MKRFLFIVGSLILSASSLMSQEIKLTGEILDKETKEAVPYVHIINASTQQGTVSNTEGRFWVTMKKTDTLQFSAIGFETYSFTLQPHTNTNQLIVTIELNTATMELEPVNVFAYRNEQALKRALVEMDVPVEKEEGFKIPGVKEAQKRSYPEGGGFTFGGPLTTIAKVFSKEEKEKKKLREYKKDYEYQTLITSKYNKTVVMEITNIPEDKVEDFMKFCVLEDSFIYRATEYELATVLYQCRIDFEKLDKE